MQTYTAEQLLSPSHSDIFEEIVLLIAHSFTEDPGMRWTFNNFTRSQYISVLPANIRFLFKAALLSGAFVTAITNDDSSSPSTTANKTEEPQQESIQLPSNSKIRAVGVLIPSSGNVTFESIWTFLKAGLLMVPFQIGFGPFYKSFTQIAGPMSALQDRIFSDPGQRHGFWHLLFLATHPDSQGQGLGKKILNEYQDMVGRSEEGKKVKNPLYLEASSTGSRRLYERVGFVQQGSLAYGDCRDKGGDLLIDEAGLVQGGRMFGMVWTP